MGQKSKEEEEKSKQALSGNPKPHPLRNRELQMAQWKNDKIKYCWSPLLKGHLRSVR